MLMNRKYMMFYFEGRDDEFDDDDLDIEKLAEQALNGPDDPHTVVLRAVQALAVPLEHGKEKREWIEEYKDWIEEIRDADPEEAYRHFVKGQIDETTADVLVEVLDVMDPREVEVDEEDEDDGDDEDDED